MSDKPPLPTMDDIMDLDGEAHAFSNAVQEAANDDRTGMIARKIARIFAKETEAQCWASLAVVVASLTEPFSREERMHMQAGFILLVNAALEETYGPD